MKLNLISLFYLLCFGLMAQEAKIKDLSDNTPIIINEIKSIDYKQAIKLDLLLPVTGVLLLDYEHLLIDKHLIAEVGLGATLFPNVALEENRKNFEDLSLFLGEYRTTKPQLAYSARFKYFFGWLKNYSGIYLSGGIKSRKYSFITDDQFEYKVGYSLFDKELCLGAQLPLKNFTRIMFDFYSGVSFQTLSVTGYELLTSTQKQTLVTKKSNTPIFIIGVKIGIPLY